MKKALILIGIAALIGAVVAVSARSATRKGTKVYEEEARTMDRLVSTVKASGEIQPRVYVNISSQVPGEIVDLNVKEGDRVRRSDVLLQLDPRQYRASVERLEANLRMARINLEREKTALATYQSTLRRQEALARSDVVSAEALDQARLQVDTARITAQSLEETIRQAEADLVKSNDELAKTTIRAPMDGLVTRVNAKLGEQVIIGTMNNPGTVILVLSDMSELLAEVRVDETEVAEVKAGHKASVDVDAVEGHSFHGLVTEIAHTAIKDRDVQRFTVKVSMAASEKLDGQAPPASPEARELPLPARLSPEGRLAALRPGMSAHASIEVAEALNALVVPIQAVVERPRKEVDDALSGKPKEPDGGTVAAENGRSDGDDEGVDVLFVDRKGIAEIIRVTTGLSDEFNVQILGATGLQPGDKVVVGPYRTLKKLKHGDAIVQAEKDEDLKEPS
ncbi:MAG: efflux RND transporter periplasmic adaptor subunit [Candidatus Polarisedimenticolia bacterium]